MLVVLPGGLPPVGSGAVDPSELMKTVVVVVPDPTTSVGPLEVEGPGPADAEEAAVGPSAFAAAEGSTGSGRARATVGAVSFVATTRGPLASMGSRVDDRISRGCIRRVGRSETKWRETKGRRVKRRKRVKSR